MTDAEIKEIEERHFGAHTGLIMDLIATVKEQRELLRKCDGRIEHKGHCLVEDGYPCECDQPELQKQIEEMGFPMTENHKRREKELRELLNHATEYMRHAPTCPYPLNSFSNEKIHCDCGYTELQKQIEEKVKS